MYYCSHKDRTRKLVPDCPWLSPQRIWVTSPGLESVVCAQTASCIYIAHVLWARLFCITTFYLDFPSGLQTASRQLPNLKTIRNQLYENNLQWFSLEVRISFVVWVGSTKNSLQNDPMKPCLWDYTFYCYMHGSRERKKIAYHKEEDQSIFPLGT